MIHDVSEADFPQRVVERSCELPVVVDFWAAWCGPCRTLGPALEKAVSARGGKVELAKVDVDSNQSLAAGFGVRGIPAVKAFREGQVVAEFTGAIPPAQIERWLDELVPSEADELLAAGDEESLRRALELDPRHTGAATALARRLLEDGNHDEARALLEEQKGDFLAEGLLARATLQLEGATDGVAPETLEAAFSAWDADDRGAALDTLQQAFSEAHDDRLRDLIRQVMVAIFTELGPEDPLAREHRRRLAAALN
jgi:putative thioredoxin